METHVGHKGEMTCLLTVGPLSQGNPIEWKHHAKPRVSCDDPMKSPLAGEPN